MSTNAVGRGDDPGQVARMQPSLYDGVPPLGAGAAGVVVPAPLATSHAVDSGHGVASALTLN
jgi:hypothetical protein